MVRPIKPRFIGCRPGATYFKPRGIPLRHLKEEILSVDETEAIRLKYKEELDQKGCAKKMKVSQSTFQRILTSVNKKIAEALIDGKAIRIEGGEIKLRRTPRCRRRFRRRI